MSLLSGDYACVAENDNGAGESSPLEIQVLCKCLGQRE